MEKGMNDKVKLLRDGAGDQEEFMKKLAELDEKGQLTDDALNLVNGGSSLPGWPKWFGFFLDQL